MKDKYSAVWVSHSSISDYLKCPRAYYLANMYRDPKTNHKITLMQPPLALGQAVHGTIEIISTLPLENRFTVPLEEHFNQLWDTVSGKRGGFREKDEEKKLKARGLAMIKRLSEHPGPLQQKAIKIRQELPYYWLSEEDNIILCGKIDWLEYRQDSDSVRIIDFKTGKFDEDPDSLQLPIYYLVTKHAQTKKISGLAYWYLDRDDEPIDMVLPDENESARLITEIAKKIALARKLGRFVCREGGCRTCKPFEAILAGKGEYVGVNDFNADVYIL